MLVLIKNHRNLAFFLLKQIIVMKILWENVIQNCPKNVIKSFLFQCKKNEYIEIRNFWCKNIFSDAIQDYSLEIV